MTKLLRILTGVHAGAEVRLAVGAHRIGTDDDADIRISDWRGEDIVLSVDESGLVRVRRLAPVAAPVDDGAQDGAAPGTERAPASDEEPGTVILIDFVPMQFGDTVICVGSLEGPWPGDLDLLSTLLVKPDETRRAADRSRRRRIAGIVSACAMLGAVIVIGAVMLTTVVSRAALPHNANELAQRVNLALGAAHLQELHAQARGSTVVVTGMVATPEEDIQARNVLARVAPDGIVRHYDVAQNDVRTIADSLGIAGVSVTYAGHGAFAVSGKVANPDDVKSALDRMRHDLSDNVKTLRVAVTQQENVLPSVPSFSLLMSSDDVRYAETPDGVKHIYTVPEAAAASDAAVSGAVAATGAAPGANAASDSSAAAAVAASAASASTVVASGAARGVMQPVMNDPAAQPASAPPATKTTAYLPLPK